MCFVVAAFVWQIVKIVSPLNGFDPPSTKIFFDYEILLTILFSFLYFFLRIKHTQMYVLFYIFTMA